MSQRTIFVCLLICFVIGTTSGQKISCGGCPVVSTKKMFDYKEFAGVWYEAARFPSLYEYASKCVINNHTIMDDGTVRVTNQRYLSLKRLCRQRQPVMSFEVMDTDYNHYALIHSCNEYLWGTVSMQFNWIFSRKDTVPETVMNNLMYRFNKAGIDVSQFEYTEQDDCPSHAARTKYKKKKDKKGDKTDSNEIDTNDNNISHSHEEGM
ncbi:apolipoprotein D-like [Antedon mediterranea]|uniref:apolipoprotein D-like n=1 Tax=Antedon mediterranea TaxID=105859 RepID=UPI003AF7ABE8